MKTVKYMYSDHTYYKYIQKECKYFHLNINCFKNDMNYFIIINFCNIFIYLKTKTNNLNIESDINSFSSKLYDTWERERFIFLYGIVQQYFSKTDYERLENCPPLLTGGY